MTYAFLVALGLGGLSTLLMWMALTATRKGSETLKAQGEDLKRQLQASETALALEKAARKNDVAGLEVTIAALKLEVAALETDLAANRDPAAVRARLNKLTGGT